MSLGYPHFPLRRGDVYFVKTSYVENQDRKEEHPAIILRDERYETQKASFTVVAFGTSQTKYSTHPLALEVDPKVTESLDLNKTTFFLAYRLHTIDKKKYVASGTFVGRLPEELMAQFDDLLFLALQMGEYKPYPDQTNESDDAVETDGEKGSQG